ncbi:hypothetical protein FBU59_001766 [Linderina macrospora]|uniref:Uncharacterized protein n=1 Tax=Linderina macrospora TaxID=4868 RepID=A0ACC1JD05_9FUNG|nr:hypothetical protein FBU59_001766 [Linderina macrospora]
MLNAMCTQAERYLGDKVISKTTSWCIGITRVPQSVLQPMLLRIVRICSRIMTQYETSTSIAFECLTAIDTLARRLPVDMRKLASFWCFPVMRALVSSLPRVRSKADTIIRLNIPWLAADAHKPELDSVAKAFLDSRLDYMLQSLTRLIHQGESVYAVRAWGMLMTVCAKYIRPRINEMLKVIQVCFNSGDPPVLVAALMQWRCLVYSFQWEGRIGFKKCVQLIMTPITSILANKESAVEVRLACMRCWATLVYALGDGVAAHSETLIRPIAEAAAEDDSVEVLEVVARVLASLLNQLVLLPDKTPKFVVSPVIIGTTTLAASDGKSLAETHGPFSSVGEFSKGDNTGMLGQYVVGVPTESVGEILPYIIGFIGRYIETVCQGECQVPDGGMVSFAVLCNAVCVSLSKLGNDTARDISSHLASVWTVFSATTPICPGREPCKCPSVGGEEPKSLHEVLAAALLQNVGDLSAQTVSLSPEVVDRAFPLVDQLVGQGAVLSSTLVSEFAALFPETVSEHTAVRRHVLVGHLSNAVTLALSINDAISRNGGISASCWKSHMAIPAWQRTNSLEAAVTTVELGTRIASCLHPCIGGTSHDAITAVLQTITQDMDLSSVLDSKGSDSDQGNLMYLFFRHAMLLAGSPWFAGASQREPVAVPKTNPERPPSNPDMAKHRAPMWKHAYDAVIQLFKENRLVVNQPTAALFARLAAESTKSQDATKWVPRAFSVAVLLGIATVASSCDYVCGTPGIIAAALDMDTSEDLSRNLFYLSGIDLLQKGTSELLRLRRPQTTALPIMIQICRAVSEMLESDPVASTHVPQNELDTLLTATERFFAFDSKDTATSLVATLCVILESAAPQQPEPAVTQEPPDVAMDVAEDPPAAPESSVLPTQQDTPDPQVVTRKRQRVSSSQPSSDCASEQGTPTKKRKAKKSKKRSVPTLASVLDQLEALLVDADSQSVTELCAVQGRLTAIQQVLCEAMGSKLARQNEEQQTEQTAS